MTNIGDHFAMLDLANGALSAALGRLDGAGLYPEGTFAPITECLWWVVCIDDGLNDLAKLYDEAGHPGAYPYRTRRETAPSGRLVRGLRFARNAAGHRLLAIGQPEGGLSWPISWPMRFDTELRWRPASDIPEHRLNEAHRPFYVECVQGQLVVDSLHVAALWLRDEREYVRSV